MTGSPSNPGRFKETAGYFRDPDGFSPEDHSEPKSNGRDLPGHPESSTTWRYGVADQKSTLMGCQHCLGQDRESPRAVSVRVVS
jgi:hypothetical protein